MIVNQLTCDSDFKMKCTNFAVLCVLCEEYVFYSSGFLNDIPDMCNGPLLLGLTLIVKTWYNV